MEAFTGEVEPYIPWKKVSYQAENGTRYRYCCGECENLISSIVKNVVLKKKDKHVQKKKE